VHWVPFHRTLVNIYEKDRTRRGQVAKKKKGGRIRSGPDNVYVVDNQLTQKGLGDNNPGGIVEEAQGVGIAQHDQQ